MFAKVFSQSQGGLFAKKEAFLVIQLTEVIRERAGFTGRQKDHDGQDA